MATFPSKYSCIPPYNSGKSFGKFKLTIGKIIELVYGENNYISLGGLEKIDFNIAFNSDNFFTILK